MLIAQFDGACGPRNPGGHATWGAELWQDGKLLWSDSGYIGHGEGMTNNLAEYHGALAVLKQAVKYPGTITLRGDSMLVISQLGPDLRHSKKRMKAKAGAYLPVYREALSLIDQYRDRMLFEWVPRDDNKVCDQLSKRAAMRV